MVRNAVANNILLNYLADFSELDFPIVGLILGQPAATKDYIVHFARTPPYNGDGDKKIIKKLFEISEVWVADHAHHATRMLPGGMYVLGIFVVSVEDVLTTYTTKLKAILIQINKKLENNKFLHGLHSKNFDKLVLHYSSSSKSCTCRSYNLETGLTSAVDIKFEATLPVKWLQLECKYDLDKIFPIVADKANWSLKKHMNDILKSINSSFKYAVFFFDGDIKDEDDTLESIGKKRKVPRAKMGHHDSDGKLLQVTIVLPGGSINSDSNARVVDCEGQIRLAGHVATKLWLHPKATVKDASVAVIEDIERSLAARLEMHWDSLIEEEHGSSEDVNSIHEMPRRVLVKLPSSKITLSDYLFPGEGPQEAHLSLKELLDVEISEVNSIIEVEGQADLTDICNENIEADSDDILQKLPKTSNKYIYFTGLGIAFLVLIISLLIHFIQH